MAGGGAWEAAGRLVLGGIQKNATQSGEGATGSQRYALSKSGDGMQMQEAPRTDPANVNVSSPSKIMFPKEMEIPGDSSLSWTQGSRDADAAMFAPTEPARGGFSMAPLNVDSGQQQYQNSGIQQYLNYMKYRGGY